MPSTPDTHDDKLLRDILELVRGRYFGKYRGLVASTEKDSTRRGRIQVIVPAVLGDQVVWAMPCVPYAGANVGFHMLPPENAGVWVEFEAGDPSYPIWSGCYWASDDVAAADESAGVKFLRTDKFTLRIDDNNGELVLQHNSGAKLTISLLKMKLEAADVESVAKLRNLSVNATNVSINDGTQEVA